jgi:2,4-dienoyl-CoA reductase-like NADH-dependent reductase (Old Yellow Enzyme family)/thioredoxin reductase
LHKFKMLFEPVEVGPVVLRNRVVSSANYSAMSENGFFGERIALYHAEKAKGGVALTITEELAVHPTTEFGLPRNVRAFDQNVIPGFKLFTGLVHRYGAQTVGQLWHGGIHVFNRDPSNMKIQPVWAVSPVPSVADPDGSTVPKEMTIEDIRELQEGYARTAQNLLEGGFDGVEIHSSHGYLPQQFLSPLYNKRSDRYGGSRENRMRFLLELVEILHGVTRGEKILGIRLLGDELFPGGLTIDEMKIVASMADSTGKVDYFNVTHGSIQHNVHLNVPPMYYEHGFLVHLAARIKRNVKRAKVFAVGRITSPIQADDIISRGDADLVVMMRAQIADPELVRKAEEGRLDDIIPCIGCNQACLGHVLTWGIPISCILNPTVGREKQWGIGTLTKAERRKHVLVVGAGPAGCEASIVAAKRGHDVTLIERNNRVGGQVRLASLLPGREEFGLAIDYWEGQLQKLNVEVLLNKEATESDILNGPYDSVVIATGSTADRSGFSPIFSVESRIQGLEGNEIVCTVDEIVSGVKKAGYNVVVYDDQGDIKGVSVAEMLLNEDREVEVVSRLDMLGQFVDVMTRVAAQIRVFRKNVKFTPDNIIKRINERELTLMNIYSGIESKRTEVDTLVLITWRHANKSLYDSLRGKFNGGLYCIGDAVSPRTVEEAVYEGHKVGREI